MPPSLRPRRRPSIVLLSAALAILSSFLTDASPAAADHVCETLSPIFHDGSRTECPPILDGLESPEPPVKQSTDPNGASGCVISVDNPHISGVDVVAKTRVVCSQSVDAVDLTMILFRCPNQPTGPENTWNSQGCAQAGWNQDTIAKPVVGNRYTGQVTAPYVPNAWWVGCTVWKVFQSPTSTGYYGQSQGNTAYL